MSGVDLNARIYVAGHNGMVGSAIVRALGDAGHSNIITTEREDLDLTNQLEVREFFDGNRPEYVYLAAAKVGGIAANDLYPADFLAINLAIQNNVIDSAYRSEVAKLLFLGSSCIYPRLADQPIREDALLSGYLEPTNEWYAIAKIAGIKMCQAYNKQHGTNFISAMPTNLYGPHDNFNLENSHVLPALIARLHSAKVEGAESVVIWGTGKPLREFLYVDDLAQACLFLMGNYESNTHINVGTGIEISIHGLASLISGVVGYRGELQFDTSKPDGSPRKLLDVTAINDLGWQARTPLEEGVTKTYEWYLTHLETVRV